jgi:hypothetical protein
VRDAELYDLVLFRLWCQGYEVSVEVLRF